MHYKESTISYTANLNTFIGFHLSLLLFVSQMEVRKNQNTEKRKLFFNTRKHTSSSNKNPNYIKKSSEYN